MRRRKGTFDMIFDSLNAIIMVLLACITLYPMWYMAVASLTSPSALARHGSMLLWPDDATLYFYKQVFQSPSLLTGYRNTIIIVAASTVLNLLLTALGAYALSRSWLRGKPFLIILVTVPMFFSGGLVPSYLLIKDLGMYDTLWALILPGAVSSWNIILMRTYFKSVVSDYLEESAKLDGANDMQVLFRIMLPLAAPIIAVITLNVAVGNWNAWFGASIYLKNKDLFPLQLILRSILIKNNFTGMQDFQAVAGQSAETAKGMKYATVMISTLPILCVYPFLQKYFAKGIMMGSLKG